MKHTPVCIPLSDRKHSHPAQGEKKNRLAQMRSKEALWTLSVFEASQSNRTRKKTGILFLLSIRVNEKDGAQCILNTRILTSKPCWSHNRQLCDSLSRASENPCILCFSNFNENFISPGSHTRGRKGLIEQINAWKIDLSFHVPERLLVPVARLLPIIWMIHFV